MNILVADSSTTMSRILKSVVNKTIPEAYIEHALDGLVAMDMLSFYQTDLVLCNWQLPRLNGIELVKRMRRNPNLSKVPVIMVSSVRDRSHVMTALQAGVNDICIMPIDPEILSAKLTRQKNKIKR